MRKILKLIGFYKVSKYIDVVVLSSKTKYSNAKLNYKIQKFIVVPILFIYIISLSNLFLNIASELNNQYIRDFNPITFIFLMLIAVCITLMLEHTNKFNFLFKGIKKKIRKEFKLIVKKKFDVNLKDPEFIKFINEYYKDIREKELSKKETIEFINNWKDSEKLLSKERIEDVKKQLKEEK